MRRLAVSIALACACLVVLAACGGGGSKSTAQGQAQGGAARNVDPTPTDSMTDVLDRIRGASTASSCEAVKGLLHSTYGGDISSDACKAVKAEIDGFKDAKGEAWKTGAAIQYRTIAGQERLAALALDADRTYRIAYVQDVT